MSAEADVLLPLAYVDLSATSQMGAIRFDYGTIGSDLQKEGAES